MTIPELIFLQANRVWRTYPGGRKLDTLEGKPKPEDSHFPEDWIGSTTRAINKGREDIVEGLSSVSLDGESVTLKALCEQHPDAMLGQAHVAKYGPTTQFLLKFLDSAIRLHIQCHPTVDFAREHLNSNSGKTEAYVILGTREEVSEPYIYMGFQHPPEPARFKRIIEQQDTEAILACFDKVPVQPGDVFIVPGGMPHAIGEGIFMIEIMEPTDFAVRIEFERGGYVLPEASRFMNRGIDFALSMFNFDATPIERLKQDYFCEPRLVAQEGESREFVLIDRAVTPCFRVNRIDVRGRYEKTSDTFYIAIVTRGSGSITVGDKTWALEEGMKFFVPYLTGSVILNSGESMELVVTAPPE